MFNRSKNKNKGNNGATTALVLSVLATTVDRLYTGKQLSQPSLVDQPKTDTAFLKEQRYADAAKKQALFKQHSKLDRHQPVIHHGRRPGKS